MNKAQMPSFGNAAFTFMLGVLNDKQLADGISALLSSVASNPTLVTRLNALKDVASSVSSRQWLPMLTAKKLDQFWGMLDRRASVCESHALVHAPVGPQDVRTICAFQHTVKVRQTTSHLGLCRLHH